MNCVLKCFKKEKKKLNNKEFNESFDENKVAENKLFKSNNNLKGNSVDKEVSPFRVNNSANSTQKLQTENNKKEEEDKTIIKRDSATSVIKK